MNETARPKPIHVPGRFCCQTCRRVLSYDGPNEQWIHPQQDTIYVDHEPIAVPDLEFTEIHEKCDFCFADETTHVLPAGPFETAPGHLSDGNWGACTPCAELIAANKWGSLARRVRERWPEVHSGNQQPLEFALGIRMLWRNLRKHVTGPIAPVER